MTARLKTAPRKRPRQERAQETVSALLEATAKVLMREGYDRASTNRIALAAGVSIGSLYQYFPSKEALFAALIDQHCDEMSAICQAALARCVGLPLEEAVRGTVRAMVETHALNPKLHKVIQEQVPRVGKLKRIDELHTETAHRVREQLAIRQAEIKVRDLDMAAFFLVQTVDALIHATLHGAREVPDSWSEDILVDEISVLLLGYLRSSRA